MNGKKDIFFSKHALEQIERRGLSKQDVNDTLRFPSKIINDDGEVDIYQKFVLENDKPYLYRVFVNKHKMPPMVIIPISYWIDGYK